MKFGDCLKFLCGFTWIERTYMLYLVGVSIFCGHPLFRFKYFSLFLDRFRYLVYFFLPIFSFTTLCPQLPRYRRLCLCLSDFDASLDVTRNTHRERVKKKKNHGESCRQEDCFARVLVVGF